MDDGIVRRTHITTAWFGAIVLAALRAAGLGFDVLLGVAAGAALMCLALAILAWTVRVAVEPEHPRPRLFTAVFLLKLPILGTILFLVTRYTIASGPALAGGIALPILVLLCKMSAAGAKARPFGGRVPCATPGDDRGMDDGVALVENQSKES